LAHVAKGVEEQTEKLSYVDYEKFYYVFINKMDREGKMRLNGRSGTKTWSNGYLSFPIGMGYDFQPYGKNINLFSGDNRKKY
jgi:peptide subunit release factor RF-3